MTGWRTTKAADMFSAETSHTGRAAPCVDSGIDVICVSRLPPAPFVSASPGGWESSPQLAAVRRLPPPLAASRSLAPPMLTGRAHDAVESPVFPASQSPSRPDLDEQVRVLLARSGTIVQRQRAERQEFDERLVSVLRLLTELTEERRFLEARVAVLEDRLTAVERVSANAGDLARSRTEQLDNRLGRLERSFIGRRHLRES